MAGTPSSAKRRNLKVGLGLAAAGFAIVAAAVAGFAVIASRYGEDKPVAHPPMAQAGAPAAGASATAPVAQVAAACSFEPLVAPHGTGDGRFDADTALQGPSPPSAKAFTAVAEEAASQGRWRDAEVALIAACRVAGPQGGAPTVPLASAQSRLAQLYVDHARREPKARAEANARAQELLAASAATYETVLGKDASRTRMAARRAAALAHPGAVFTEPSAATSDPSVLGAARQTLPRADVDLPQLDDDLARLRAQAGSVTRDPAGFQRRTAQAEAQRQACNGDESCLRRWAAQRRRQLLAEF